MNDNVRVTGWLRCLVVWLLASGTLLGLVLAAHPELAAAGSAIRGRGLTPQPFDRLLVWVCAAIGVLAASWLWVLVTLVVLEALDAGRAGPGRGVPHVVRRLVLVACGVAVLGAAGPAVAGPGPGPGSVSLDNGGRAGPARIEGLPLPDRATGGATLAWLAEATRATVAPHVVVRPGDSLWTIAARDLQPGASDADIAAHWKRIYRLNRDLVGSDPDLIQPDQRLELPPT